MSGIDKAIVALRELDTGATRIAIDARIQLIVALGFVVVVLTVPLTNPGALVWMFAYPIIMSEASGVGYLRVLKQSLWVLPLIAAIGMFNPILDTRPVAVVMGITLTEGWVTFAAILLRGLLSVQALLVLTNTCGFREVCRALQRLGCPAVLVTQLMMLYRYIGVLLEEAQSMHRARLARGFGRKSYPLKMWSEFVGQLLLRSIKRAQRVHLAMLARGFNGNCFVEWARPSLHWRDLTFLLGWAAVIIALRFLPINAFLSNLISR